MKLSSGGYIFTNSLQRSKFRTFHWLLFLEHPPEAQKIRPLEDTIFHLIEDIAYIITLWRRNSRPF